MKKYLALLIIVASLCAVLYPLPASAVAPKPGQCEQLAIPVALTKKSPADQHISGTLCTPTGATQTTQLDVLVHGITYDRSYWDSRFDSGKYSYVDRTLQQGRATFAFDRIGSGQSSRPLGLQVTLASNAYTTHQAIQWLKANRHFSDISLIGHSFGSGVAIEESATYDDVNRVVDTGLLHTVNAPGALKLIVAFTPAALDPAFAGKITDLTYLTTRAGTRNVFYNTATANPALITYDEAHKGVVSDREVTDIVAAVALPPALNKSTRVRVPVLTIMGDQDKLFCDTLVSCASDTELWRFEAPYYSRAASFTARTVPNTGHNLAFHPSTEQSFTVINAWIEAH